MFLSAGQRLNGRRSLADYGLPARVDVRGRSDCVCHVAHQRMRVRSLVAGAAALPRRPASAGNTKGGCPFVPERQSDHPCNPQSAAPDAPVGIGRTNAARPRQWSDSRPPSPSRSSPERQSRLLLRPAFSLKGKEKSWHGSPTTGPTSIRKSPTR